MGNVFNIEFEERIIKKGMFQISCDFEEFYQLDDLHYVCSLFCGTSIFD